MARPCEFGKNVVFQGDSELRSDAVTGQAYLPERSQIPNDFPVQKVENTLMPNIYEAFAGYSGRGMNGL